MSAQDNRSQPSRREEKARDKVDRIISAALKLFAERGFHGTAVPEVAKEAGVGAGTIYRYFEHKEALMAMIWGAFVGLMKAKVLGYLQIDNDTLQQAEETCWRMIRPAPQDSSSTRGSS